MKQLRKISCSLLVVIITSSCAYSQHQIIVTVPWVSEKGYWMAESNIKTPTEHIIRFYTNDKQLIHTEQISGVELNFDMKSTKMKLKRALEQTITFYRQHMASEQISDYLVAYFK